MVAWLCSRTPLVNSDPMEEFTWEKCYVRVQIETNNCGLVQAFTWTCQCDFTLMFQLQFDGGIHLRKTLCGCSDRKKQRGVVQSFAWTWSMWFYIDVCSCALVKGIRMQVVGCESHIFEQGGDFGFMSRILIQLNGSIRSAMNWFLGQGCFGHCIKFF